MIWASGFDGNDSQQLGRVEWILGEAIASCGAREAAVALSLSVRSTIRFHSYLQSRRDGELAVRLVMLVVHCRLQTFAMKVRAGRKEQPGSSKHMTIPRAW